VIIESGLTKPRDIALDPNNAMMYWTDWGSQPKIERAFMNGKERQTLVAKRLQWPNGIFLDFASRRIYWVDAYYKTIEYCNFNGKGRVLVRSLLGNHPFGVVLYNNNLYFSDWTSTSLTRIAASGRGSLTLQTVKLPKFSRPNGLALYRNQRTTGELSVLDDQLACEK
jgi:hypothetical protein